MAFDPSKAGEHDERCPGILKYSPRLSISYSSWSKILAYSGYLWNVSWFHATQTMIFEQNQGKPMGTWWYPSTDAMDNFFSFRSFLVLLVFRFQSERKIPLTSWISTGSDESSMPLPRQTNFTDLFWRSRRILLSIICLSQYKNLTWMFRFTVIFLS